MRTRVLLSLLVLITTLGCSGGKPTELRPEFATVCTPNPTLAAAPASVSIATQTAGRSTFTLKNNCASTSAGFWDFTASRTGAVTSISAPSPAGILLGGGATANILVDYNTGATAGLGTVTLTAIVEGSPNTSRSATQTVKVTQAGTGIPFGLWGLSLSPFTPGATWTGGVLSSKDPNRVLRLLDSARTRSPRVGWWFGMTGGDETVFRRTDGSFNLPLWKATLDAAHGGTIQADGTSGFYAQYLPYIQDGTFRGIVLLDDLAGFNPPSGLRYEDVESMAAFSKKRFPTLPTAVRDRATQLQKRAPLCSTCPGGHRPHQQLDAGWAQYRSDQGKSAMYRDAEILAATQMQLGLVIGINITDGGPPIGNNVPTDSLLAWGTEFLKPVASDYVCGFFLWQVGYQFVSPDMATLANMAKNHVTGPCKRRP